MKTTIEELIIFSTIAQQGTIYQAAEQLQQTPSSISRALKRLEKKLNLTLIERTTRKLKLTHNGNVFLRYAREIINKLQEAEDSLSKIDQDINGVIRIDSATPFVLHVLTPIVIQFLEKHPNIEIELTNNEHIIDLLSHNIDIAIRIGSLKDSSLHAKYLTTTRSLLVASPDYLARQGIPQKIEDLTRHQTIGFSEFEQLNCWPYLDQQLECHFLSMPKIRASSGETVRSFAIAGAGIAYLSSFLVIDDIQQGRLLEIQPQGLINKNQEIHAVYHHQGYLPKRMRVFIDFLCEALQHDSSIDF
ncbi:LysR substrate-binding domain-containing protein [Ignatzschineria larvae]